MKNTRANAERDLFDQLQRSWSRHAALVTILDERNDAHDAASRLLLSIIGSDGPIRSSDLAERVGLSRASVSRRVAELEAEGFVAAQTDPNDKRAALLAVTPDGAHQVQERGETGGAKLHELVNGFTEDELATFAQLLRRLNDRADAQLSGT